MDNKDKELYTEEVPCRVVRFVRPANGAQEGCTGLTVIGKFSFMSPAESNMRIHAEIDRKWFSSFLRTDGPCYLKKVITSTWAPRGGLLLEAFNNEYIYTVLTDAEYNALELDKLDIKDKPNYGRFTGVVK